MDVVSQVALVSMGLFGVFLYFRKSIKKRDELLPEEKNRKVLYEELGGGRFYWINIPPPYVKLRLYDDFLVISFSQKILLRYQDIDTFGMDLSGAVRIFHHDRNHSKKIIFGSKSPEALIILLNSQLSSKLPSNK